MTFMKGRNAEWWARFIFASLTGLTVTFGVVLPALVWTTMMYRPPNNASYEVNTPWEDYYITDYDIDDGGTLSFSGYLQRPLGIFWMFKWGMCDDPKSVPEGFYQITDLGDEGQ